MTCSVNCAGRSLLRFSALSCAAIDPQFVPTQMDIWHMVEKFHAEVVDYSSEEESDQSTQTFATTAASMIHEFTSNRAGAGSVKGHSKTCRATEWKGSSGSTRTTSTSPIRCSRKKYSGAGTGCQGSCSWSFSGVETTTPASNADPMQQYLRMGESTFLEAMYRFCRAVIVVFGQYYYREPNVEDTRRLLSINESRGFPGMIDSIDCMHWEWKNCPFKWQGQYNGHEEGQTVILEVVRQARWAPSSKLGFDVLQARWAIIRHPARTWSLKTMHEVMTCCVIMHNLIVENEHPDDRNENHWEFQGELVTPLPGALSLEDCLHMSVEVTDENVCKRLQTDLIEH
ncbi:hypothetical protein QYE76_069304 [Lolium multiflorum]|uniref:Uncharacterized protein n=1 Tax=Lolium multiflorum TaxID=4521 RepID=A0AAD8WER8_LOLMU|nr:hypothetical protein QYE76_069304 [Lolium multiflorum]